MRSLLLSLVFIAFVTACNSPEQNTATGNSVDSTSVKSDSLGDTRGMNSSGTDITGSTPGPGTITDTLNGKVDTAGHASKPNKDSHSNR